MSAAWSDGREKVVWGWLGVGTVGLAVVVLRAVGGHYSAAWSVGAGAAWLGLCAGIVWFQLWTRETTRSLEARGVSSRHAGEMARSLARRRGIVLSLAASGLALVAFLLGLIGLPVVVGQALRGSAAILPALLLVAMVSAWVELMGGSVGDEGPHCGRCGYPVDDAVRSTCPECGMECAGLHHVTDGGRSHPLWVKIVGITAPLSLIAVMFATDTISSRRVAPALPSGVLIQLVEVEGRRGAWSRAAVAELSSRQLTASQDAAFKRELDRARPNRPPAPVMAPR